MISEKTKENRQRFYPATFDKHVVNDELNIEYFLYQTPNNKPALRLFEGRRTKPSISFFYHDESSRNTYLQSRLKNAEEVAALKAKEKEAFIPPFKAGDILVHSWGYDQTNVEFYKVLSTTKSGKTLTIVELSQSRDATSSMSGSCIPNIDDHYGEPFESRVTKYGRASLSGKGWRGYSASKWSGKPAYFSSYA